MGVSRKNQNVGGDIIGYLFQGLKAYCPYALFWPERCLKRRREDDNSECCHKRRVPFSSALPLSLVHPTHTVMFQPGIASVFSMLSHPALQMRGH